MALGGYTAAVRITWVPEDRKPPNADAAQRAIDAAYGPPYVGTVELGWDATVTGWDVYYAWKG